MWQQMRPKDLQADASKFRKFWTSGIGQSESRSVQGSHDRKIMLTFLCRHFSPQPETLKYAQFITNKFDLRKDMQFDTKVKTAHWQNNDRQWLLSDASGKTYSSRFLITAMGILNDPTLPNIPGVEDFKGEAFHTSRWPSEWSLDGKRVGIIGYGVYSLEVTIQTRATCTNHTTCAQDGSYCHPNHPRDRKVASEALDSLPTYGKLVNELLPASAEQVASADMLLGQLHSATPRSMPTR